MEFKGKDLANVSLALSEAIHNLNRLMREYGEQSDVVDELLRDRENYRELRERIDVYWNNGGE